MPYPKKEETQILWWERRLEHAKKVVGPHFKACETLLKQYDNEAASIRESSQSSKGDWDSHTRRVKANIIFGWVDQNMADMFDHQPVFKATPKNPPAAGGEAAVTRINNHYYRSTEQLHHDERVGLDAFLLPYGVSKIGWTADMDLQFEDWVEPFEDFQLDNPADEIGFILDGMRPRVTDEQDHASYIEFYTRFLQDPQGEVLPEQLERLEDYIRIRSKLLERPDPDNSTTVNYESPFGLRWEPDRFLVDPLAQDGLHDARWIAFGWSLPVEEVRAHPNYENTKGLEPSGRVAGAPPTDDKLDGDDFGLVNGWEIWARNQPMGRGKFEDHLLVVAEGHKKWLRKDTEWPYERIDNFPAEILSFQASPKSWYNKPTLLLSGADTTQALVNEILDSYLYVIRKQKNIWLYDPGLISEDDISDILQAPDMTSHPIPGLAEAKNRAVVPLEFAAVPPEKGDLMSMVQGMFDRSAGTPQPQQMPSLDTATQADIFERRNTSRENRRARLVARFQLNKQRKYWLLITQYRPDEAEIIAPGITEWMDIDAAAAKGEFNFILDISSHTTAVAMERKNLLDLLNLFAGLTPVFQQVYNGQSPDLAQLGKRLLERGYDEQVPEEILPMLNQQQAPPQPEMAGMPGEEPTNGQALAGPVEGGAAEALTQGRAVGNNIAPALPDMYNEEMPSVGRQMGRNQTG